MDTHIQFSNINFFYFALLKTSPEAKLLIIQNQYCLSTEVAKYFKLFSKLSRSAFFQRQFMIFHGIASLVKPPCQSCPFSIEPDKMRSSLGWLPANRNFFWSGRRGSNSRLSAWEADTLPLSYARFRWEC